MNKLQKPSKESIIYEDEKVYACLASNPLTEGHVVVVWKNRKRDLHLLTKKDYEYLMNKVDQIRNALLKTFKIEKVYLLYMDEIKQVHWHLVPRYNKKGFNMLNHKPKKLVDFSLAEQIKINM